MSTLRIGIDVGGTNTDAVLYKVEDYLESEASVFASHKSPTTSDITSGIKTAIDQVLKEVSIHKHKIICATIGTTHLINAIIERNAAKLERVHVIRLASWEFTESTPPFVEFPPDLCQVISGGFSILDGGLQIDGSEIGHINPDQIKKACHEAKHDGIKNVVLCGVYSPIDSVFRQEQKARDIILGEYPTANVTCSADLGGLGILERENSAILNASIRKYASFVFGDIGKTLSSSGLEKCPIFISSNDGSMISIQRAIDFPIESIASGPANSMLGAAFLSCTDPRKPFTQGFATKLEEMAIILDIGGTTTDVGVLMSNGFPRQASSYRTIAGVQVNIPAPDVQSFGIGGGSIVKTNDEGWVTEIGPDSVGKDLRTRALCFGGDILTLTDVVVAAGKAPGVGTRPILLEWKIIDSAEALIRERFNKIITRVKSSAKPLPIVVVGGGSIIYPEHRLEERSTIPPSVAPIANAVGAARASLSALEDTIFEVDNLISGRNENELIELVTAKAIEKCIAYGAARETVHVSEQQALAMPYITGKLRVTVKVVGDFDINPSADNLVRCTRDAASEAYKDTFIPPTNNDPQNPSSQRPDQDHSLLARTDFVSYYPKIYGKVWMLSEIDIDWLSIGCYILGCGGGGSPHLASIAVKQYLRQGIISSIVDADDLDPASVLPQIGLLGSPMVSVERPGGNLLADAMDNLLTYLGLDEFDASLCIEIGGSNGFSPLLANRLKGDTAVRPMVDGDLMGRAFPTYEMITPYVFDQDINHLLPASLSSGTGTNIIMTSAQNAGAVDSMLLACCVTMGCAAGVVSRPLTAKEFIKQGVLHSHSLAWRIGRSVSAVRNGSSGLSPVDAIVDAYGGDRSARIIFEGKVVEVSNHLVKGHSSGQLVIEGHKRVSTNDKQYADRRHLQPTREDLTNLYLSFKNENLLARVGATDHESEKILATVPDLISVIDSRSGLAVGVPEYRYSLQVSVLAMAAPPQWTSPRGVEIAGPRHFSFDRDFQPTGIYTPPRSVIREFGGE